MMNNCCSPDTTGSTRALGDPALAGIGLLYGEVRGFVLNPRQGVIGLLHVESPHALSHVLVIPKTQRSGHSVKDGSCRSVPGGCASTAGSSGAQATSQ